MDRFYVCLLILMVSNNKIRWFKTQLNNTSLSIDVVYIHGLQSTIVLSQDVTSVTETLVCRIVGVSFTITFGIPGTLLTVTPVSPFRTFIISLEFQFP